MMKREKNDRKGEHVSPFLLKKFQGKLFYLICVVIFGCSVIGLIGHGMFWLRQNTSAKNTQKELQNLKEKAADTPKTRLQYNRNGLPIAGIAVFFDDLFQKEYVEAVKPRQAEILQKYQELYEMNQDMVGWLTIDGTVIDYPVMQTMEDEGYYLDIDFYGQPNQNGCLIMDTDSQVGTGTLAWDYTDGEAPSTNLIIHGHTMKSGEMFGNLMKYENETYGKEHRIIKFDSLYEERE